MADPKDDVKTQIAESVEKTKVTSATEGERAGGVAQRTTEADPVLANELNQEEWWQSGVTLWGSGGIIWSVGILISQVGANRFDIAAYDIGATVTAIGSLIGFAAILYRRWWPGLKPYFWRWTQ